MRGICGIDINSDRTFLSFAASARTRFLFFEETSIEASAEGQDVVTFLQENVEALNQHIIEALGEVHE